MSDVSEVSLRAYARHREVALSAVQKAISSGRITKTASGKINVAAADAAWERNTDISRRPADAPLFGASTASKTSSAAPDADDDDDDADLDAADRSEYQKYRGIREKTRAEREQLELDRMLGSVIDLAEAQRIAFTSFRTLRDAVMNVPVRVKDLLAAETDPMRVEAMLDLELTAALQAVDLRAIMTDSDEAADDGGD